MNRFDPYLLDKLFGEGAHRPAPTVVRQLPLDELKGTVARHIEPLLNARIPHTDERLAAFNECRRSILTYGLNDFAGVSLVSHDDRTTICNSIRRAIERPERRLKQVIPPHRRDCWRRVAQCRACVARQTINAFLGNCVEFNSFVQLIVILEHTGEEIVRCKPRSSDFVFA